MIRTLVPSLCLILGSIAPAQASLASQGSSAAPGPLPNPGKLPKPTNVPQVDETPLCAKKQTIRLDPITIFPLYGDGDLKVRNRIRINLSTHSGATAPALMLVVNSFNLLNSYVHESDYTGVRVIPLDVDVPAGCEIDKVTPWLSDLEDTNLPASKAVTLPGNGSIGEARCVGWQRGDDWGRVGCTRIEVEPIEVTFKKARRSVCRSYSYKIEPHYTGHLRTPIRGDSKLDTPTEVTVEATASVVKRTKLQIRSRVTIREKGGDQTTFQSPWKTQIVGDAAKYAKGCVVQTPRESSSTFRVTLPDDALPHSFKRGDQGVSGSGFINSVKCRVRGRSPRGCSVGFVPISATHVPGK